MKNLYIHKIFEFLYYLWAWYNYYYVIFFTLYNYINKKLILPFNI